MSDAVTSCSAPRRGRGERGAALIEFAIASVILLTLLFGIISYGYALSYSVLYSIAVLDLKVVKWGAPSEARHATSGENQ